MTITIDASRLTLVLNILALLPCLTIVTNFWLTYTLVIEN